MNDCPVCRGANAVRAVSRDFVPAMQNYVHRTREEAIGAARGRLSIDVCRNCGLAWNSAFEPGLLVYDERYDNAVPSAVMEAYYRELATYLADRHDLEGGLVVDVGCGNGSFLKAVCDAVPACRGLGVDPALPIDRVEEGGRVVLVKDVFAPAVVEERPSLLVCRHVLEHMPQPVEFLREIRAAVSRFGAVPCFFEVPDLRWILDNDAFWDLSYEHSNYFTDVSFATALGHAGFDQTGTRLAFGSQYRWVEASATGARPPTADGPDQNAELADRVVAYGSAEATRIVEARDRLRRWKSDGRTIAVWGMATKGVLFSLLVDPRASLIDFCIDVNANKQGCFVPLTGHVINAPAALATRDAARALTVVVMNENYRMEIEAACRTMGLDATVLTMNESARPEETVR